MPHVYYRDLTDPDAYRRVPRIDREDVRVLWIAERWDGPLNGAVLYQGRECWFENPDGYWCQLSGKDFEDYEQDFEEYTRPRRYLVLALPPEQIADERRWHKLFEQFGQELVPPISGERYQELLRTFREKYGEHRPPDVSDGLVLGWFEGPLRERALDRGVLI